MIPVGPMVAVANTIENDPGIRIKRIKRKSRSYIGESIRPIKRLLVTSQGPALAPSGPGSFISLTKWGGELKELLPGFKLSIWGVTLIFPGLIIYQAAIIPLGQQPVRV